MARGQRTRSISARFAAELIEKLDVQSRRLGKSKARLAERLIDEGLRVQGFPGSSFGPVRLAGVPA